MNFTAIAFLLINLGAVLVGGLANAQESGPETTDALEPGDILMLVESEQVDPSLGNIYRKDLLRVVPPTSIGAAADLYTFDAEIEDFFWSIETSSSQVFLGSGPADVATPSSVCCSNPLGCEIGILSVDPNGGTSESLLADSLQSLAFDECGVYNDLHLVDDDRLLAIRSEFTIASSNLLTTVSLYDADTGEGCALTTFVTAAPLPGITSNGVDAGWTTQTSCDASPPYYCTTDLLEISLDEGCLTGHTVVGSVGGDAAVPGDPVYANGTVNVPRVEIGFPDSQTTWEGYDVSSPGAGFVAMPDALSAPWAAGAAMYRQAGSGSAEVFAFSTSCFSGLLAVPCSIRVDRLDTSSGSVETILEYEDPDGALTSLSTADVTRSRISVPEPKLRDSLALLAAMLMCADFARRRELARQGRRL